MQSTEFTQFEGQARKSSTVSEITVIVKDEEKSLRAKYLIYDVYEVTTENPIIKDCIAKTLENFGAEPTDVNLRIKLEIL
jgi:hypothetical protein